MNRKNSLLIIGCSVVLVVGLWAGSFYFIRSHFRKDYAGRGQFGDLFGAVNALFSGLAFAGIIYTVWIQQKEIDINTKELERQNLVASRQHFENTFFQLLQFHNEIVKSTVVVDDDDHEKILAEGRDFFTLLFEDELIERIREVKQKKHFPYEFDSEMLRNRLDQISMPTEQYLKEYEILFDDYQNELAHYFRSLYQVVRLIDDDDVITEKNKYIRIVRAQLSTNELLILFYNGLTDKGIKFKFLIEKYGLFKSLDKTRLLDQQHSQLYSQNAYGR